MWIRAAVLPAQNTAMDFTDVTAQTADDKLCGPLGQVASECKLEIESLQAHT